MDSFRFRFLQLQYYVHRNAREHGWWDEDRNNGELISWMHSELSELFEALRCGNPLSEHISGFSAAEEELADVVILAMDMAEARGYRLAAAIEAKHCFNLTRPHKHGKKF